jgi:predicted permease
MGENATLPLSLDVAGEVVDVVGVTAGGHEFPAGTELWLPRSYRARGVGMARNSINYHALGRLRAGWDLDRARADLDAVARGIREQAPEALYSEGVGVISLRDHVTRSVERELLLVLGAVAGVLLLACVNLAGLGLARTLERTGELGVRVALGAPRRRVVRQLLTEHALLALAGGVMGVAAAAGLVALAGRNLAGVVPGSETLAVDGRVLLFALALTGFTAMLSGGLPALRGRSLARSAAGAGRGAVGGGGAVGRRLGGPSLGGTLVVAQVSLAMVLLVGAGLLLRSFQQLVSRDLGFEPRGVYVGDIALEGSRYRMAPAYAGSRAFDDPGAAARRAFFDELVTRLGQHPAVSGASVANRMPAGRGGNGFVEVEGWVGQEVQGAGYSAVGHDYFQILSTPRIAGRTFSRLDDAGSDRVVVVNRAMARTYWPGEDPLGRRVRALSMEGDGSSAPWLTVIGVVGDVLEGGFDDEPSPHMYVLAEQVPYWMGTMYVVFRTDAGAEATRELRDAVASLDRSVPVEVSRLEDRLGSLIRERRAVTGLLSVFAGLALLLAAVGLYALLAFQVARRTREMGVRAALGADRTRLTRMILGHGLRLSGWGVGLGLAVAWVCVRVLTSFLVDVAPVDPPTWASAAGLLLAIGLLSAGGPAWRAARADPLTALRSD